MTESDVQPWTPDHPPVVPPARLAGVVETGLIVDLRSSAAFAGGHLPGSISLAGSDRDLEQAGEALLDLARVVGGSVLYLMATQPEQARRLAPRLARATGTDVAGVVPVSALTSWASGGGRLRTIGRITPAELQDRAAVERMVLLQVGMGLRGIATRSAGMDSSPPMVVAAANDETTIMAASLVLAVGRDGPVLALEGS